MSYFDETINKIFKHCEQILRVPFVGDKELNKLMDQAVLSNNAKPSPLLKFYNQLQKTTGLDGLTKALLTLDQKVFKEYIARLARAQNYQIRITKEAAQHASARYMKD